jgi:8-oxo-dGTP pyrophosphatase MutT (NUDIX family)
VTLSFEDIRRALRARPGQALAPPVGAHAAVALILRHTPAGLELLFIRRAEHPRDPWSGQMAFPGGRAEPADVDRAATAVREVMEEIGLDLRRDGELLGALDEVRAMARLRPMDLGIQPFVFRLHTLAVAEPREEVTSVHWLPLQLLLGEAARSVYEHRYEEQTLEFPCVRIEQIVIWGLTYRMLMALGDGLAATAPGR